MIDTTKLENKDAASRKIRRANKRVGGQTDRTRTGLHDTATTQEIVIIPLISASPEAWKWVRASGEGEGKF